MASHQKTSWLSRLCSSARRVKPIPSRDGGDNGSSSLVRRLGLFELILIGVGASIGAGIFVVTGTVAREAGPGVTISFLLAGASCVLNALCYAELSCRFPAVSGGAYLYTYSAFNEITAFLVFVQLMLDYHIGAASISRSLAGYIVTLLRLIPALKHSIPTWIGSGEEFFGGTISINVLAPVLLLLLTLVLCRGVGESSIVNSAMTVTKIIIVIVVIFAGAFHVDVENWSPFAPHGFKPILTGATVVFFSYVGFDAVANSAEESKKPQRDLPMGILGSLVICIALYIGVCLVLTGMVPFGLLSEDAPLASAFTSKGMKFVTILISVGAVAGLTTTLLVGLYVQSRLYLGIGRDGLLPPLFSKVNEKLRTPIHSQVWCGIVAGILAGLFNIHSLSHILSVGTLTGYSVVAACVVALRLNDYKGASRWSEGILCVVVVALSGFAAGAICRFDASFFYLIIPGAVAIISCGMICYRKAYGRSPGQGFRCPGVPVLPCLCIFFNMFLFAQLHFEAWVRFVAVSVVAAGVYALYGQYHADPSSKSDCLDIDA
ncbi:PREDICTED: cationic amino acid transporter 9, chloroplastic-like [Tarenaya hassleriana]|uniref:cationic amino acid transporter 9, chloroplastic-like n=1 Tax=Tarenaya hassleriana TaxID=28532 RepID=UPI00053C6233|nr:PREDICTED: cationic amino acid transporter 9, chloroplastic-like [Tarenaya hassleriana]